MLWINRNWGLTIQNWEKYFVDLWVITQKEVKVKVKKKVKRSYLYVPYLMDCYVGEVKREINLEKRVFYYW